MKETKRRRLIGVVTSNKMEKTVSVEVVRRHKHPRYGKIVNTRKSYKAHDELGCRIGDQVEIIESAPISKTKKWVVTKVMSRSEVTEA